MKKLIAGILLSLVLSGCSSTPSQVSSFTHPEGRGAGPVTTLGILPASGSPPWWSQIEGAYCREVHRATNASCIGLSDFAANPSMPLDERFSVLKQNGANGILVIGVSGDTYGGSHLGYMVNGSSFSIGGMNHYSGSATAVNVPNRTISFLVHLYSVGGPKEGGVLYWEGSVDQRGIGYLYTGNNTLLGASAKRVVGEISPWL